MSTNAATIFGRPEATVECGRERGRTVKYATRTKLDYDNGNFADQWTCVSSAALSRINAARFDNFLAQARTNLDPDEEVIFVYDGAPAHRNPVIPAPNTELKMLPPHSPFPNIADVWERTVGSRQ